MPYQAAEPGQGQDPSLEPRVEVVRRLIAYPARSFAAVINAAARLDQPGRPVRWTCYRDPGHAPARPYWLCFLSSTPEGGRRFHFGMELFDRERLGLWIFSGYEAESAPPELLAPFAARPEVSLPRLELSDAELSRYPIATWLAAAYNDSLRFRPQDAPLPVLDPGSSVDQSVLLDASLAAELPAARRHRSGRLPLRSSRARLVVDLSDADQSQPVQLHPLSRLSTLIGRDVRCNLAIEHPTVSAEHCRITWRNGVPGVEECGSKNGTQVDGSPLKPDQARAIEGQEARLRLGDVECLFVRDPEAEEEPAHTQRLQALRQQGLIDEEQAAAAQEEANQLGITPGEVLLKRGVLKLDQWHPPRSTGSCLLLFLLLPLLMLAGCGHSFAFLPPVGEWEADPIPHREGTRRVEWDYDLGIKPLFQTRKNEELDRREVHALFPLGLIESSPEQRVYRLYPFFQRYERTDPDGFPDTDTIFFPFVFTGSHPVDGGYFYLFPFGGTLRGLLGKDEAIGVLFPLYGWARDGENETHHVMWPLFATTSGGGHSGWRLLPFYGHFRKERDDGQVVFDRTTVLWPFFHYAYESTNSRNPYSSLFVFPFYGRTRSDWVDDNVILWPLFRWWTDKRTDYSEVRAPFPFFIYGSGPDHTRVDLWPVYGYRHRGDYTRHFWLWPIGRSEHQVTEEYDDHRFWLLPLLWFHSRLYSQDAGDKAGKSDFSAQIWPLAKWEDRHDGYFEVRVPAPLWVPDPLRNFDRILEPLWTLFHYRSDVEGYREMSLLLGLFSARSTPQGEQRWDVLGGLVGHTTTPEESRWRFLWFLEF